MASGKFDVVGTSLQNRFAVCLGYSHRGCASIIHAARNRSCCDCVYTLWCATGFDTESSDSSLLHARGTLHDVCRAVAAKAALRWYTSRHMPSLPKWRAAAGGAHTSVLAWIGGEWKGKPRTMTSCQNGTLIGFPLFEAQNVSLEQQFRNNILQ